MMGQMMQHMMSMQQAPTSGGPREFTDEEMNEINKEYAEQMEQDTPWAVHGDEADWMTLQERADAMDDLSLPQESKPLGFGLSEARADGLRMPDDSSTSEWQLEADHIKTLS